MEFIFQDEAFKFETLRAAGFAADAGADIGEVIVTTSRIPEGDEDAWTAAWTATADRTARRGHNSLDVGDSVSAREAFFRASSYYRSAEFYRRKDPLNDPQVLELSRLSKDYLVKAAELLDGPFSQVQIPFDGGSLPGYLFLVDDSGTPAQQSSTPTASTPPARRATSSSAPQHCGADTTSSHTTGRGRAG